MRVTSRLLIAAFVMLAVGLVPAGASTAATISDPTQLAIISASNTHPEFVSGGQVLVRLKSGPAVDPDSVRVTRDRRDVTSAFVRQDDGTLVGLVTGLADRSNIRATASAAGQTYTAALLVHNHSIDGPVFSGPRQQPYICQTDGFGLTSVPSSDVCQAQTKVTYLYRTTKNQFVELNDPNSPPGDVAMATVNGRAVPYVVRLEQGVIDRSIYELAALWDGSDPSPTRRNVNWNRRLVYTFGGGCNGGYHQGLNTGGVVDYKSDLFLRQGYAVASSTLNVYDINCSTVLSAEAAMMVKEHVAETYGPIVHTIGWGGSGGGIQQYGIANSYPGILDGIVPQIPFSDGVGTTLDVASDCRLLLGALGDDTGPGGPGAGFTVAQKQAVSGFNDYSSCTSWNTSFANRIQATASCKPVIPTTYLWNPQTNPDGIKCSAAAQNGTQLGINPATGFPNSFLDNVGLQYGLTALEAGLITATQFADLNRSIGGFDYRGEPVPQRSRADAAGLRAMYGDDLIMNGGLGLATTPVLDVRTYLDPQPGANIHTSEWDFVIRHRMSQAGAAGNQVILQAGPQSPAVDDYVLAAMDEWLDNISGDHGAQTAQQKVAQNKPAGLQDGCFLGTSTTPVDEPLTENGGTGPCATAYPVGADPRLAAGQPWDLNTLKCRLAPLDRANYPGVTFSDTDWATLRRAFPGGVCDYSRPGIGEVKPRGIWLDYSDS